MSSSCVPDSRSSTHVSSHGFGLLVEDHFLAQASLVETPSASRTYPLYRAATWLALGSESVAVQCHSPWVIRSPVLTPGGRSEERRVGKERGGGGRQDDILHVGR